MGLPFHLRCLGRPQLVSPAGEPVRFRVRKHLALLTYFALEPSVFHRREKLADLLWASVPMAEGRHSLATAVSIIRSKLGRPAIEGNRDHVRLVATNLSVDLERLAAGDVLGDEFTPVLQVGGFLEDFEIPDAQEFMLWRERQRARWLPLVRDALVRLIDRCRRTGDFKQIEHLGTSLLEIDDLSEDGIRARMEARAFDGDRLTSLKIFEAWKAKLAEELNAVPSPLVEGIAIRLRRRDWEGVPTSIPTVPTDQWRGRPFVGRAPEYRILYESWEGTTQRLPQHVLVLGDSGVGKSTLLDRVATAAGLEGAALSRVSCYELEREIPYAAIGGLIAGLLDRPGVSGTAPEWLAELSRTIPEVRRRFPGIPEPQESQGEAARIRLTEAAQQLLLAIADEHPVILIVDDVHLADDASLAVLHLLIRRMLDQRIMVLFAARPAELGQSPHAAWLREGHEHLGMRVLELDPMTSKETEELLGSFLSDSESQPSATARRALLRAAAGFPMVLEYLVKDWQVNGEQCLALSIGAMTEELHRTNGPIQTYHLILQRIALALEPSARNVLNMASVLGGRLNDIEMYQLADVTMGQTMSALGRLTDLRILRDGGRGLEFSNELIRGEAYLSVPSPIRKSLHQSVAKRLLAQESSRPSVPGLEIAWHCIRAGMRSEATPYLLSGAREAIRRGAAHEAERALETALGHLEEPVRTDAQLLLAEALHEQGRWENVLSVLSSCQMDNSDNRRKKALILSIEPRYRLEDIIVDRTVGDSLQQLLTLARFDDDHGIRVKAITNAAYLVVHTPDRALTEHMTNILKEIRQVISTDEDAVRLALVSAILYYHTRDFTSALRELQASAECIASKGMTNLLASSVHLALANIESSLGDYERASKHNFDAFQIASQIGNDRTCARIAGNLTMCAARRGEYLEAIDWYRTAEKRDPVFRTDAMAHCLFHASIANEMLGRRDEAIRILRILEILAGRAEGKRLRQNTHLFLADGYAAAGQISQALEWATAAITGDLVNLQTFNSAGVYSRWLAAVTVGSHPAPPNATELGNLFRNRESFDRIDRTEILCSNVWLDRRRGQIITTDIQLLNAELAELPPAISDQLQRMGFLGV
jgi:DNA-binding SARP family transcriptional activator/tetratricopeptide (TPR) repeat protein